MKEELSPKKNHALNILSLITRLSELKRYNTELYTGTKGSFVMEMKDKDGGYVKWADVKKLIKEINVLNTNEDISISSIEYLINKYEDKIKALENLKKQGGSTWGSEAPTIQDRERFEVRIYERNTFIQDLKSLIK